MTISKTATAIKANPSIAPASSPPVVGDGARVVLGNITITPPVILAPMSGVSDRPFRTLTRRMGAGMVVNEMIASQEALRENRVTMKRLLRTQEGGLYVIQLAGHDPRSMAEAAKFCQDLGVDIVDLNFGCPAKKVTRKLCGSALMQNLDHACRIIEAVRKALDINLTIKTRLGWDHNRINAPEFAMRAEALGVSMITVHGRTRAQKYSGHADWSQIKKVKKSVNIPVIVNGDIRHYDDIDQALCISGADGIMIGRGAQGRPWFPGHAGHYLKTGIKSPPPPAREICAIIHEHYHGLLSHHGKEAGMRTARKHLAWYACGFRDSALFRKRIMKLENPKDVLKEVDHFFLGAAP